MLISIATKLGIYLTGLSVVYMRLAGTIILIGVKNCVKDKKQEQQSQSDEYPTNKDQQAVDKAPGENVGEGEQVTKEDLKGKKVDRDPDLSEDQPIRQLP